MEKDPYFKPSIDVDFKTIIIIVIILVIVLSAPFVISFIRSGGTSTLAETFEETLSGFSLSSEEVEEPFIVTIPIINVDIDLTVVKQNPQLVTYAGLAFFAVSILIGITLIRSLIKE